MLNRLLTPLAEVLDRRIGWDCLPRLVAIPVLVGLRARMRRRNLHDTGLPEPSAELLEQARDPEATSARTLDGTLNDLSQPLMGSIGTRFGRNVPLRETFPEPEPGILEPNPRAVSRELLTRREFIPATTLNVLAAVWLQFEVHDWFSHSKSSSERPWELPVADDDPWEAERPLQIPRTLRDPTSDEDPSTPPTYVTGDTHWWDGSQIYGSDERFAAAIRSGEDGKLRVDPDGLLPQDLEQVVDLTGVAGNFWVGLGLLHTLFTLEHNSICDRLRAEHPTWPDRKLYEKARLVNAALQAKIHTVEWTPAVISHPTTRLAMHANWWGLVGERLHKRIGRRGKGEVLFGIPGSPTNHHSAPYSLTEEFVAVYRMHPLTPDDYVFRSVADDRVLHELTFPELGVLDTRRRLGELGTANAFYSFGVAHPGAITLHNFPRFLQAFRRFDGTVTDLAAVDVMRTRERGVPRYARFRELLGLKPPRSFAELTGDPVSAAPIERVYGGRIDRVDTMIGLYAEPKPKGFGFSDTAFRIFVLMASRRLKSDRFYTRDYTPEMYTQAGLDWINENTMTSVLLRHYPELAPALRGVENAFAPWKRVA